MIEDVLWIEKYRPTELSQLALTEENRNLLQGYIDAGVVPHLLFSGPPGVGKTTAAKILIDNLDCKALVLNASSERGIDVMRDKVGLFVRGMLGAQWNIVFLDEADALTPDAQTALRNMFETYADQSRFILSANYAYRVIDPLKSRCVTVEMNEIPIPERFRVLSDVLHAEGIPADPAAIASYATPLTDMRQVLMEAQKAYVSSNSNQLPMYAAAILDASDLLEMIDAGKWAELRKVSKTPGFNHQRRLVDLFWAVEDDHPTAANYRWILGRSVHESGRTPDPVVHFLGTCAELMET